MGSSAGRSLGLFSRESLGFVVAVSTAFAVQSSRSASGSAVERRVDAVFVSTLPDDYGPEVANVFASLGADYDEVASRVFERDPVF